MASGRALALAASLSLLLVGPASARQPPPRRRAVVASPRTGPVIIDGRIEEPAWGLAKAVANFWQRTPDEGAPPRLQTTVRVLYDRRALYVALHARDSEPHRIRGILTRRDEDSPSDWLGVAVDSYRDGRTAFAFIINPAGVQRDLLFYDDSQVDASWNAVWDGAAAVGPDGWSAELRLPFSQLRYAAGGEGRWGIQFSRLVARTREETFFSPSPRASPARVSHFGVLRGLQRLPRPVRLELLPYAKLGLSKEAQPGPDNVNPVVGAGLDIKYGVTSNLTLDFTVNPDFGQVEADPATVNLTAYETFFPEQRPFFVEGADIFRAPVGDDGTGQETLFYSRRIGAPPRGSPDGEEPIRLPRWSTIYGAAKLSGKLPGGLSLGALQAVTAEEWGTVQGTGGPRDVVVEPLTSYSLIRLRREAGGSRTGFGLTATAAHRSLEGTGFEGVLHDQAYTGQLGVERWFRGDEYLARCDLLGSYVHGSPEAVERTQRAAARTYQRPDADHLRLDPQRTSLSGLGLSYRLAKEAGAHLRGAIWGYARSPGFEVNDLGYLQRSDLTLQALTLQLRDDQPRGPVHSWNLTSSVWEYTDFAPQHLEWGTNASWQLTWVNFWVLDGGYEADARRWSPGALRGGPTLRDDLRHIAWLNLTSDSRRRLRGNLSGRGYWIPASDGRTYRLSGEATLELSSNLSLGLGAALEQRVDEAQYVATVADGAGLDHYVLGRIDQTTLSATARAAYTISPALSLQLYAQPFISAGSYSRLKEVVDPTAAHFADRYQAFGADELRLEGQSYLVDRNGDGVAEVAFEQPDFTIRQLRYNVVLRWEYSPGSTLFAVWSHDMGGASRQGQLALGRELQALVQDRARYVLLVKVSYWLGV